MLRRKKHVRHKRRWIWRGRLSELPALKWDQVLKDIVIESIVGVAEEWDADLIVLGWHGRTALKRLMFGSVAGAVIHGAPCSVELIRYRPERCESEACRRAENGES